mgnify:CR=1 FL=1
MKTNAAIPCPSCRQPMEEYVLPGKTHGTITLDLCYACQGIWFDEFESLQLAPAGILELFHALHDHHDEARQPWRDVLQCPRCDERMVEGLDVTKNGKFSYHRCLQKHGRFNSFGAFFQEKGFVRQLTGAEIEQLAKQIQTVRCSGCGAPVDIRKQHVCGHCRAPIVVLDADAVQKAAAGYKQAADRQANVDPMAMADALLENERAKRKIDALTPHERRSNPLDTDITDLVMGGISLLWNVLRR